MCWQQPLSELLCNRPLGALTVYITTFFKPECKGINTRAHCQSDQRWKVFKSNAGRLGGICMVSPSVWIPPSTELNPTALTIDPGSHLQLNWIQLPWQSILDPIFNWAEPNCLDSRSWIPSSTELNPAALILHVNFKSLCTQVSLGTDTGCRKQEKHKLKKNSLKLRWMESWEA